MKKIRSFLLAFLMILTIGTSAYAVNINVYGEQWTGAKYDFHQDDPSLDRSYDLSSNFFGFELVARRFYFGAENGVLGSVQYSSNDQTLDITDLKFGCRVVKNDVCTLDIFNGFLIMDGIKSYYAEDDVYASITLGGNLDFNIADRVLLHGSCELPLAGYIVAYNIKAGLLLAPHFAITAGYRGYEIVDDDYDNYYYNESTTSRLRGLTMGMELKF